MVNQFADADQRHMRRAINLAKRAARLGEVPIGAVLVDESGRLMAADHNRSITNSDPTAHAEMLCLRKAASAVGNYRLTGTTLYVTLEPCPMCAGALVWARVKRVVFAASDSKAGAFGSVLDLTGENSLNHKPLVQGGLMAEESVEILQAFFARRRKGGKNDKAKRESGQSTAK